MILHERHLIVPRRVQRSRAGSATRPLVHREGGRRAHRHPVEVEPAWQQDVLKRHTQLEHACGFKLKFVQTPLRQTWLTLPPSRALRTQRQVSAGTPAHESLFSPVPRCPYWQSAHVEQVSLPLQTPSPHVAQVGQALQLPQAPHVQLLELQLRERVCVPPQEVVHARVSRSVVPGEQVALVAHEPVTQLPQVQLEAQRRVSTRVPSPHAPHVPLRLSRASGAHTPSPSQPPSSAQSPATQAWRCTPHRPQGTSRGAAPSSHAHSAGALHSPHTPAVHSRIPSPQALTQSRWASAPTSGSESSQSEEAGTPSSSASTAPSTQRPPRHVAPPSHAGTHSSGGSPASRLPASRLPPSSRTPRPERGLIPSPPSAHPAANTTALASTNETEMSELPSTTAPVSHEPGRPRHSALCARRVVSSAELC